MSQFASLDDRAATVVRRAFFVAVLIGASAGPLAPDTRAREPLDLRRPVPCAGIARPPDGPASYPSTPSPPGGASAEERMRAGTSAYQLGKLEQAASHWDAAALQFGLDEKPARQADALLRLGQALRSMGHLQRALDTLERASELAREAGDRVRQSSTLAALGEASADLGDADRASELLDEAFRHAQASKRVELMAMVLNSRGNLLVRQRRHGEAADVYRKSASLARQAGDAALGANADANALRAALESGPVHGLPDALRSTLRTAEKQTQSRAKAQLLIHVGRTCERLVERDAERGAELELDCARALRGAAEVAEQVHAPRSLSYALGYLAGLYEMRGRRAEALSLTRRALFHAHTAAAPEALYLWQWQLGRLLHAEAEDDEAVEAYRAAVATLVQIRAETGSTFGGPGRSFESSVGPVFFGLVDLLLKRAAATEGADERQALLREARATVEVLKVAELRNYLQDECLEAQQKAPPESIPGTVVIYPIALEDRTELIVSFPAGLKSFKLDVPARRLAQEALLFRKLLEKRTTNQYRAHGSQLYEWLIRPLEEDLEVAQLETLVVVPDAILRTIPLAALYDRQKREFLIQKYPLAITPGLTLTEPRQIERESVSMLRAGITESVQGFPPLPFVEPELQALGEVYGGTSLIDADFVSPTLERELRGQQVGILHVATHAEFGASSSESFLLTYDGRLSINDLTGLVGITQFRDRPLQLLTLSACQTAAGDDQAALGLAGIAVQAGARSALATLWFVNDRATSELLPEFYRALAEPGVSRARALQQAQLSLIGIRRYRHPGYWAPFLLISNWL